MSDPSRPIINTYDQLRAAVGQGIIKQRQAVYISYYKPDYRDVTPAHWIVGSPYFKTAPDAPYRDNGCMIFLSYRRYKESLQEAMEWCRKQYGITAWSRNRAHDYVPRVVNKAIPIPAREK